MNDSPPASGIVHTLRQLGASLATAVQDRFDLAALEIHEEKLRLIQIVIWINIAIFTGMLAVTFLSLTLVVLFWETARQAIIVALALVYTGVCAAVVLKLRRMLVGQPRPFSASREEIARDNACIQRDN